MGIVRRHPQRGDGGLIQVDRQSRADSLSRLRGRAGVEALSTNRTVEKAPTPAFRRARALPSASNIENNPMQSSRRQLPAFETATARHDNLTCRATQRYYSIIPKSRTPMGHGPCHMRLPCPQAGEVKGQATASPAAESQTIRPRCGANARGRACSSHRPATPARDSDSARSSPAIARSAPRSVSAASRVRPAKW